MERKNGVIVVDLQGGFTQWKHGSLALPGTGEEYERRAERATIRLRDMGGFFPLEGRTGIPWTICHLRQITRARIR
jgi:hypothetical protein